MSVIMNLPLDALGALDRPILSLAINTHKDHYTLQANCEDVTVMIAKARKYDKPKQYKTFGSAINDAKQAGFQQVTVHINVI